MVGMFKTTALELIRYSGGDTEPCRVEWRRGVTELMDWLPFVCLSAKTDSVVMEEREGRLESKDM